MLHALLLPAWRLTFNTPCAVHETVGSIFVQQAQLLRGVPAARRALLGASPVQCGGERQRASGTRAHVLGP